MNTMQILDKLADDHEALGRITGYLAHGKDGAAGEELAKLIGRLNALAIELSNATYG